MSRDHIAQIHCNDVTRPTATATRICKRLARDGHLIVLPQPKDRPYLYKSKETNIRDNSSKLEHHLAIVDTYIELGCPDFFEVEPDFKWYKPDVYCRVGVKLMCIEIQKSKITNEKMQHKIRDFVRSYQKEENDATTLWIKTPFRWTNLKAPPEIEVIISPTWE